MLLRLAKKIVLNTPLERPARALAKLVRPQRYTSSDYWESRYQSEGNSGAGSYGRLAQFKAEFLNDFVARSDIADVIEYGMGDGNQLKLASYPKYIGFDVSQQAVQNCRKIFADDPTKSFKEVAAYAGEQAELTLSLDVIYHLVEDSIYETYMETLFASSKRFVIIYASDHDEQSESWHVRQRKFTPWIAQHRPDFRLVSHVPNAFPFDPEDPDNTSIADFYVFEKS